MSIIRKAPFGHVVTAFLQSSSCRRGSVRLVFALALTLALAACDDDESSFVRPGEDSSSSVCEDCDDASSSSVKSNSSSSAKSSSSVNAKSSSSVRSSSSAPVEDLSSSSARSSSSAPVEDLSSSSVRSSSSVASSSSAKSSSSSAKSSSSTKSSSSVSSSSEYVPYDHLYDLGGVPYVSRSDYKTFTDERNGRSYYYLTIRGKNKAGEEDSVTVMAENLNIGKMITYVKDQADDTTIERYCYDRDTTNCDRYGGLYQWAEMMQLPSRCNTESCADLIQPNHQGICPDGWRLLTQDDFYIVLKAENNKHGIEDVRAGSFGGYNYTGYSLVGAGSVWNRRLDGLGTVTYWYYPEEGVYSEDGTLVSTAFIAATSISETSLTEQQTYKTQGLSVRCVKVE